MKKISVILPVYNGMQFLEKSVRSVLNQELSDFDFLICDDCSADESYEFLSSLNDKRIKLFRNAENEGLFPTLNFLIKQINTRLIHLWAQDDVMQPDCLLECIKFHEQFTEVNFSFSRLQRIDAEGKLLPPPETFPHKTLSPEGHALSSILYGSISGNIANVCLVKKAAEEVGLFDESMAYAGDFKMWCRLSKKTPVGMNGKILVHVRQHPGQLSRNLEASYLKLVESREVFECFLDTLPAKLRTISRQALKWKIYPIFFSQYLKISKKNHPELRKKYRKSLKAYGGLFLQFFRWSIIHTLRLLKKEQWFYRHFFYKKIETLRK